MEPPYMVALKDFNAGWGPIIFFVAGLLAGALLGTYYAVKAQRPRLRIFGAGSGGNSSGYNWRFTVSNHPSFLGSRFYGESAHDVRLHLRKLGEPSATYLLRWSADPYHYTTTIEPGTGAEFPLFFWRPGDAGYVVLDQNDQVAACFSEPRTKFELVLFQRIGPATTIPLEVTIENWPEGQPPTLRRYTSWPLTMRRGILRSGRRVIWMGIKRGSRAMVLGGLRQMGLALRLKTWW